MIEMNWSGLPQLLALGVMCSLCRRGDNTLMYTVDERFHKLRVHRAVRPAAGGAMLGLIGVAYVILFGWWMLHQPKPIGFHNYPMPAFYGDGYGAVQPMLTSLFYDDFYARAGAGKLLLLLIFLCLAKIAGTCLTLGSGGSGGIIAPSLFLGTTPGHCSPLHQDPAYSRSISGRVLCNDRNGRRSGGRRTRPPFSRSSYSLKSPISATSFCRRCSLASPRPASRS